MLPLFYMPGPQSLTKAKTHPHFTRRNFLEASRKDLLEILSTKLEAMARALEVSLFSLMSIDRLYFLRFLGAGRFILNFDILLVHAIYCYAITARNGQSERLQRLESLEVFLSLSSVARSKTHVHVLQSC